MDSVARTQLKAQQGRAWVFGDDLNTDIIHPPDYYSLDPEIVKCGLFKRLDDRIQPSIEAGDMIIGGKNFGCGSSRETSIISLKLNQISLIIAVSFARIFFRNATNKGLPCLYFKNPSDLAKINTGDELLFDPDNWCLQTAEHEIELQRVSPFILEIWQHGGLMGLLDHQLAADTK